MKLRFAACLLLPYTIAHAEPRVTQNDFGGAGLLQTPTARMAPAGEVSFNANRTSPYSRYSISLQPFDWLEGTFRYTSISNKNYGSEALSGSQSYKDKAFDVKFRLLQESHWLPELAIGGRDIGGTGLFSGEFIVANKRLNNFDFSLGLGWGYLGSSGNIDNPFGWVDDKFDERPRRSGNGQGGEFSGNTYFRGPTALFGGVNWQTPWRPLTLKLEYEGNDYAHEPLNNNQDQRSPINLGFVFKATDSVDLHAAWERGNTAMFGITLHTNFTGRSVPSKSFDPPAEPIPAQAPKAAPNQVEWAQVAQRLENNAGYRVEKITQRGDTELMVYGEQTRYYHTPKAVGRASRIIDNSVNNEIDWFTLVDKRFGMPIQEVSVPRKTFREVIQEDRPLADLQRTTEMNRADPAFTTTLFEKKPDPFTYGFGLGYTQSLGGPDGFVLYQLNANAGAEYRFTESSWLSGRMNLNLLNNFDKFKYDAESNLPHVRTDIRKYLTTSNITMPTFQLNHAEQLDQDLYGMAYAGYLESMFAGVGSELLYRPMGQQWAVGADINYVRKRGYEQDFGLLDYKVVTGHLSGYFKLDNSVLAKVSVGRYLAKDWGTTLDLSRVFNNGVRFGGWVTKTTASAEEFGEGSFDKGFYVSIPFDELLSVSTMRRADMAFAPLTRDGGARLNHAYSLYDMTEGRDLDLFQNNFNKITE